MTISESRHEMVARHVSRLQDSVVSIRITSIHALAKLIEMGIIPTDSKSFDEIVSGFCRLICDPSETVRSLVLDQILLCAAHAGDKVAVFDICRVIFVMAHRLGRPAVERSEEVRVELLKVLDALCTDALLDFADTEELHGSLVSSLVNSLSDDCSAVVLSACNFLGHRSRWVVKEGSLPLVLWEQLIKCMLHRQWKVRAGCIKAITDLSSACQVFFPMDLMFTNFCLLANDNSPHVISAVNSCLVSLPNCWQVVFVQILLGQQKVEKICLHANSLLSYCLSQDVCREQALLVLAASAPYYGTTDHTVDSIVRSVLIPPIYPPLQVAAIIGDLGEAARPCVCAVVNEALTSGNFLLAEQGLNALPANCAAWELLDRCSFVPSLASSLVKFLDRHPANTRMTVIAIRCGHTRFLRQELVDEIFLEFLPEPQMLKKLVKLASKPLVAENLPRLLEIAEQWLDQFDVLEFAHCLLNSFAEGSVVSRLVLPCLRWRPGRVPEKLRTIALLVLRDANWSEENDLIAACASEDCVNNRYLATTLTQSVEVLKARLDDPNDKVAMLAAKKLS